jgi:hypothetical protein
MMQRHFMSSTLNNDWTRPFTASYYPNRHKCLLLCWFLDAGNDETRRTLNWPASKKRQASGGATLRSARAVAMLSARLVEAMSP